VKNPAQVRETEMELESEDPVFILEDNLLLQGEEKGYFETGRRINGVASG
jgi:hypothetical protein